MQRFKNRLKDREIWYAAIAFVFLSFILSSYFLFKNPLPNQKKATQVYYADHVSPAIHHLIESFNQEFAGEIEVIPVDLPFLKFSTNERKELLTRALRSKSDRIDIFTVDVIWIPRFARWSEPLDAYFDENFKNSFLEQPLKACTYQNKLVAMPFYTDIGVLYYRKDILARLPNVDKIEARLQESISWEEFIRLKDLFRQQGINNPFYVFPADNYEGLICSYFEGLKSLGAADSTFRQSAPESIQSLQLLTDLIHKHKITPVEVTHFREDHVYSYAAKKDAIFFRGWPGSPQHFLDDMKKSGKLEHLRIAALPHMTNGDPAFVIGGWNFMISRFSKNKEAAVKFIKFCLKRKNQEYHYRFGNVIPVNKSVYSDTSFLPMFPKLKYYHNLYTNGVNRPVDEDYTKVSDIMSYYLKNCIENNQSVESVLKQATKSVQKTPTSGPIRLGSIR